MATIILLVDQSDREFCLRQEIVSELARLGVTNVTVLRDEQTVGL